MWASKEDSESMGWTVQGVDPEGVAGAGAVAVEEPGSVAVNGAEEFMVSGAILCGSRGELNVLGWFCMVITYLIVK